MLHTITPCGGTEAQLHAFLNSLVEWGEYSALRSDGFTPSERIVQFAVESLKIGNLYPRILEIGVWSRDIGKFDVIGRKFPVKIDCKWKNTWHRDGSPTHIVELIHICLSVCRFVTKCNEWGEYSYNESQPDALFVKFILINNSTCFGQVHSPSSGVSQHCIHAIGVRHASSVGVW